MGSARVGLRRRLAWFAALYVASLGVFAALVYGLKALVRF